MPTPADLKLYEIIKKKVYKEIPLHSAYRSGILVQKYKEAFKKNIKTKIHTLVKKQKKLDLQDGLRKNG